MNYYIPDLLDGFTPDIEPDTAPDMAKLREAVSKGLAAGHGEARKRPKRLRRTLLIVAAVAALLSVTAIAAALGGFDWLRETINPPFIDAVEPVEQSVTDQGIRFSIIAAQKFDDTALVYFSLTDTEGLDRVTESSTPILSGRYTHNNVSLIYYDSATQTAVYEATFGTFDSICLGTILNNHRRVGPVCIDTDLADAYLNGERIGELFTNFQTCPEDWLTPGYIADIPGVDGAYVSAVGDNGRLLAVQYCWPITSYDGIDYSTVIDPYLMDAEGNRIDSCLSGFVTSPHEIEGMYTTERYFQVDADTLAGCTLWFDGTTSDSTNGNWPIEIDYSQSKNIRRITADVEYEGETLKDAVLNISPIVVTIHFDDNELHTLPRSLVLEMGDNEVELFASGEYYRAYAPLDPSTVTAIRIGDTVIELE